MYNSDIMKTTFRFFSPLHFFSLVVIALFCVFGSVTAATTISTSITTDGSVSAASASGGFKLDGSTMFNASTTGENTQLGYQALSAITGGGGNTALGHQTLKANTTGDYNTALGNQALISNTTGQRNSAVGASALFSNTTGEYNTAMGIEALGNNITGTNNTAVGASALQANTAGIYNSAFGNNALENNTEGNYNVAVGISALNENITGYQNTAVGENALAEGTAAIGNTAVGSTALGETSGSYNVGLGLYAGRNITTGTSNMILATATSSDGLFANLTTGSQNIIIGNNISFPSATANGQLNIGNIIYGTDVLGIGSAVSTMAKIGIGTTTPGNFFSLNHAFSGKDTAIAINDSDGMGTDEGIFLDFRSGGNLGRFGTEYDGTRGVFVFRDMWNGGAGSTEIMRIRGDGRVGIGTTTPLSQFHVTSGASATTTVNFGEAGSAGSKACFNTKNTAGSDISFYFVGTSMVVESNLCR